VVDYPAVSVEQGGDATIAIAPKPCSIANNGISRPHLIIRLGGLVTLGRTRFDQLHRSHAVPKPAEPSGYARCIAGDGSGLEVSPCRLMKDQFVQGEIRYRQSQPGILLLQSFKPHLDKKQLINAPSNNMCKFDPISMAMTLLKKIEVISKKHFQN